MPQLKGFGGVSPIARLVQLHSEDHLKELRDGNSFLYAEGGKGYSRCPVEISSSLVSCILVKGMSLLIQESGGTSRINLFASKEYA